MDAPLCPCLHCVPAPQPPHDLGEEDPRPPRIPGETATARPVLSATTRPQLHASASHGTPAPSAALLGLWLAAEEVSRCMNF